jgi:hypothetical protein
MSRFSGVKPAFGLLRHAEIFLKGAACLGCVGCCNQSMAQFPAAPELASANAVTRRGGDRDNAGHLMSASMTQAERACQFFTKDAVVVRQDLVTPVNGLTSRVRIYYLELEASLS